MRIYNKRKKGKIKNSRENSQIGSLIYYDFLVYIVGRVMDLLIERPENCISANYTPTFVLDVRRMRPNQLEVLVIFPITQIYRRENYR